MRRRVATLLAVAAMMPAAAPGALAFAPQPLIGRMCAHPAIPEPERKRDGRDCPGACHAACARSSRGACDEDDGD
jgi:hypothetical protein